MAYHVYENWVAHGHGTASLGVVMPPQGLPPIL